jgi:hypothetical protein
LDALNTDQPTVNVGRQERTKKATLVKTEQAGAVLASQMGFSHEYTFDSVCCALSHFSTSLGEWFICLSPSPLPSSLLFLRQGVWA